MKKLLALLGLLFAFSVPADTLKLYDADKNHYQFEVLGSGTTADPYEFAVTIANGMETSAEGNTAVKTFIQDQTTEQVDLYFHKNLNTFTLLSSTVLDATTFTASPGHSIVIGNSVCLLEGQNFSQFNVLNVVGDVITIRSPMDKVYTSAATSIHHTFDMRTGTATLASPETWIIAPLAGQNWDITGVIIVMVSTANAMDFTGFGNLAALTNGAVLRMKDGSRQNLFNWRSNGEFINRAFHHNFSVKTGGGGSGFVALKLFGGPENQGVTVRLNGDDGDELQVLIQDATNGAGLSEFFMIAIGHVVQ